MVLLQKNLHIPSILSASSLPLSLMITSSNLLPWAADNCHLRNDVLMYIFQCRADCWSTGVRLLLWIPSCSSTLTALCATCRLAERGGHRVVEERDGSTGSRWEEPPFSVLWPCSWLSHRVQLLSQPCWFSCTAAAAFSWVKSRHSAHCLRWPHRNQQ